MSYTPERAIYGHRGLLPYQSDISGHITKDF